MLVNTNHVLRYADCLLYTSITENPRFVYIYDFGDAWEHQILMEKEVEDVYNRQVYTLLTNTVASALETVGLDPYVGFMHTDRPGRVSLALDLSLIHI